MKEKIPLGYRIDLALELIRRFLDKFNGDVYVACSFGKDSLVALHLALTIKKNIKVVFCNTSCEFPETIRYMNLLKEKWDLNLTVLKPHKNMTFFKCADKYGLPIMRDINNKRHTPRCCYYLKERPAKLFYDSVGAKAVITGLRASESRNRGLLRVRYNKSTEEHDGERYCSRKYFTKGWNLWKINPIMEWTIGNVWEYIETLDLPVNEVYKKWNGIYKRVGCLPCTAYKTWRKKLSISHPKLYKLLLERYEV